MKRLLVWLFVRNEAGSLVYLFRQKKSTVANNGAWCEKGSLADDRNIFRLRAFLTLSCFKRYLLAFE